MLGTRDPQGSLLTARSLLGPGEVAKLGFYAKLATEGPRLFPDEDFAVAYCVDNGRPSVPPSQLATACLLQYYEGISDAEVVARTRYDLRWKVALDLDPHTLEAPFAKSTYQSFRARLSLHEQEGLAFERSVKEAQETGLLPRRVRVAVDSSPVRGRGAVKDTFNLLSDAIKKVLRAVAKENEKTPEQVAQEAGLERHIEAPSIKGTEDVEWSDADKVSEFLDGLLQDCTRAVAVAQEAACGDEEVALLNKVIEQDVDQSEASKPTIRQGVAPERTPSVSDPEMRHGRKSTGKTYNGHKAHVAVAEDSGVITAVDVTAPSVADGSQVKKLVEETAENTGCDVTEVLGDSAYSSREAVRQAEEAEVELRTKMPAARKDRFGPNDFQVSDDHQTVRCPGGFESTKQRNVANGIVHLWSQEHCGSCPLKAACTQAARRTFLVATDFHERRERERFARSPEGRRLLRKRVVVEHALGRLKHLRAGRARYFGRAKTKVQWLWSAAVANLCLVWGPAATIQA